MALGKEKLQKLALISWVAVIAFIIVTAVIPSKGGTPGEAMALDKIFKFVVFSVVSFLPFFAFKKIQPAFLAAFMMPVLGFVLEYLQKNIGGRSFSPEDMIASNGGAVIGIAAGVIIRLVLRAKRQQGEES